MLSHATQRLGQESASTLQLWELQLDAVRQGLETLKESLSHYEEVPEKSKLRTLGLLVLLPEPAVEHSLMDPQVGNLCLRWGRGWRNDVDMVGILQPLT